MFHHWFHSRSGHLSFQTCSNTCLDHCFTYINTSFMLHHSYLHELKGYLSHSHLRIRSISYLKGDSRHMSKGFTINHHHISLFRWICLYLFKSRQYRQAPYRNCRHKGSHILGHILTPVATLTSIRGQRALQPTLTATAGIQVGSHLTYITFLHRYGYLPMYTLIELITT